MRPARVHWQCPRADDKIPRPALDSSFRALLEDFYLSRRQLRALRTKTCTTLPPGCVSMCDSRRAAVRATELVRVVLTSVFMYVLRHSPPISSCVPSRPEN